MTTDIARESFWQRTGFLTPYALLARWDRPIGIWLLFWPCVWGLFLAPSFKLLLPLEQMRMIALFFVGSVAMRGAGCTLNDMIDRRMDAAVTRTKLRPLPSGRVTMAGATVFLALQLLVGALVLFELSPFAILVGLCSLPLVAAYPWMKRITYWPQLFLGIVFNAGILVGTAAMENTIGVAPLLLYAAAILWTLAYDSVYAFLDSADDALIGVKSTVLLWGGNSKAIIGALWLASGLLFIFALAASGGDYGVLAYGFVAMALIINLTAHLFWDPVNDGFTLNFFRLQARIGLILALAVAAPVLLS